MGFWGKILYCCIFAERIMINVSTKQCDTKTRVNVIGSFKINLSSVISALLIGEQIHIFHFYNSWRKTLIFITSIAENTYAGFSWE